MVLATNPMTATTAASPSQRVHFTYDSGIKETGRKHSGLKSYKPPSRSSRPKMLESRTLANCRSSVVVSIMSSRVKEGRLEESEIMMDYFHPTQQQYSSIQPFIE